MTQCTEQEEKAAAQPILEIAKQVQEQDGQIDEEGKASLIKGVAKDRRISVEDGQMRHGRKSRSVRVDGYKRHVLHDLDSGLIHAVGMTPANVPEASVTEAISEDLEQQDVCLKKTKGIEVLVQTTNIQDTVGDSWRRDNAILGLILPENLTCFGVHGIQVAIIRTNVDHAIGDDWRGVDFVACGGFPEDFAALCFDGVKMMVL